jgi:hypothetical protein
MPTTKRKPAKPIAPVVCGCCDSGCPVHKGTPACDNPAKRTLRRVDMEDLTGTRFCSACGNDAFSSGLFY